MSSTDPAHLIEHKVLVIDSDGKQSTHVLKPLEDIYLMSILLENTEMLLLSVKAQ